MKLSVAISIFKVNKKKLFSEAKRHSDEAIRLLKKSVEIHRAEHEGLISESEAVDLCVELNRQAVSESEKAIELQKELLRCDEQKLKR